jgi:hypothetical protein
VQILSITFEKYNKMIMTESENKILMMNPFNGEVFELSLEDFKSIKNELAEIYSRHENGEILKSDRYDYICEIWNKVNNRFANYLFANLFGHDEFSNERFLK